MKKAIDYFNCFIQPRKELNKMADITDFDYNRLLFFNINMFSQLIFMQIYKNNVNINCERFEEGYNIYIKAGNKRPKLDCIRKILGQKNLYNKVDKVYLFHPELLCYEMKCDIEKIEPLSRKDDGIRKILNDIFLYIPENEPYDVDYLYFEDHFFADHVNIDDLGLIDSIVKLVGKDKILIKAHPRDLYNRFESRNFKLDSKRSVPWEVIQLNHNFDGKTLMTITSGSILASILYFDDAVKSVLLFKCIDSGSQFLEKGFEEYFNKIQQNMGKGNFIIPNNMEELKVILTDN